MMVSLQTMGMKTENNIHHPYTWITFVLHGGIGGSQRVKRGGWWWWWVICMFAHVSSCHFQEGGDHSNSLCIIEKMISNRG